VSTKRQNFHTLYRGGTLGGIRGWISVALALSSFAAGVASLLRALRARRALGSLEEQGYQASERLPTLSVVVPARNEARRLESALGSLVGQDYPGALEVMLVDDRSDDGTGEISQRLAREHPRLRTLRVDELPTGWLGKNHAASVGAAETMGEWLLFCDADVVFDPSALGRAVAYAERGSFDHLTLVPHLELDGYWLKSVTAFSWMMGLVHVGLYRANLEGSSIGVGIGAFNLIRREAYEKIGTHERLRLQVVDDMELGSAVKDAGLRGRMLLAQDLVSVRWHDTLRGFVSGIENTVYAGVDFSPVKAAGYAFAIGGLLAGPFWGVLSHKGVERLLYLGSVLGHLGVFVLANVHLGREAWRLAPSYPVAALMVCGILARSTFKAERRGGLVWRETFYSLDVLRKAKQ
jgi:glycosyltransferase involved in cell wall biosynthesis